MEDVISWLLNRNSIVEYKTRISLLNQAEDSLEVISAKKRLKENRLIQSLISDIQDFPGYALKRHNDANHSIHKLAFLADLGFKKSDGIFEKTLTNIFTNQSKEGAFQIKLNIPTHFGGSGEDQIIWMLCDAPLVLYSLAKIGYEKDERVIKAAQHLTELITENGWLCEASSDLGGKFRGPGKKTDPCPYANLVALKALSQIPDYKENKASKKATDTLLSLWEEKSTKKPYLFAMGTDFKKIKGPLIWYDILHVCFVLSEFKWLKKDTRFLDMLQIILDKNDGNGRYTPESIYLAWKGWDFGQKKEPSRFISYIVQEILMRL
ncbi:MAG: hypothetical protein ACFFDW_08240 [Candidatus Thorarchaeota archaeon]